MLQLQAAAGTMSSVQAFREFINQRLTAAAAEIFTEFERTIVRYQEPMDRQSTWTPHIRLTAAAISQQGVCEEEHLFLQETTSTQQQEDPGPAWVKEEQKEVFISQEEQMELKLEDEIPAEDGGPLGAAGGGRLVSGGLTEGQSVLSGWRMKSHGFLHSEDVDRPGDGTCCGTGPSWGPVRPPPGETSPPCGGSGRRFTKSSSGLRHGATGPDERPHWCVTCGKSFRRKATLLIHVRTHTGEKPYTCQTCGKPFSKQCNLVAHIRTHTGEKPHVCHTCGKRFSRHGILLRHMTTHRGATVDSMGT